MAIGYKPKIPLNGLSLRDHEKSFLQMCRVSMIANFHPHRMWWWYSGVFLQRNVTLRVRLKKMYLKSDGRVSVEFKSHLRSGFASKLPGVATKNAYLYKATPERTARAHQVPFSALVWRRSFSSSLQGHSLSRKGGNETNESATSRQGNPSVPASCQMPSDFYTSLYIIAECCPIKLIDLHSEYNWTELLQQPLMVYFLPKTCVHFHGYCGLGHD